MENAPKSPKSRVFAPPRRSPLAWPASPARQSRRPRRLRQWRIGRSRCPDLHRRDIRARLVSRPTLPGGDRGVEALPGGGLPPCQNSGQPRRPPPKPLLWRKAAVRESRPSALDLAPNQCGGWPSVLGTGIPRPAGELRGDVDVPVGPVEGVGHAGILSVTKALPEGLFSDRITLVITTRNRGRTWRRSRRASRSGARSSPPSSTRLCATRALRRRSPASSTT